MKTTLRIALVAAAICLAAPAAAQTLNSSFNVTATVAKTCIFQAGAVADLAFGAYDPLLGTEVTGSTSFQFRCTNKTPFTIDLDNGGNFSGTRRMAAGAEFLAYDLDQVGAPWTAPWGAGATAKVGSAPNNAFNAHTVFGRIPAGQQPAAGSYTDTVNITVNY